MDIEVRSHHKRDIKVDTQTGAFLDKDGNEQDVNRTLEDLLFNMSSGFSIATYLKQETDQDKPRYDAMHSANHEKFNKGFRKFDLVAMSFEHPDFPGDTSKYIRAGGLVYDIEPTGKFKVAMTGFLLSSPSSHSNDDTPSVETENRAQEAGQNADHNSHSIAGDSLESHAASSNTGHIKKSWINSTIAEREAYLPVRRPVFKRDDKGHLTDQQFTGKVSNKTILGFVKGKLIKIGR